MTWVHVCLNLEHETGETLVGRAHHACIAWMGLGRRREVNKRLEERFDTEVRQGAAEEQRCLPTGPILREVEGRARPPDHVKRLAEVRVQVVADHRARFRVVQRRERDRCQILPLCFPLVAKERSTPQVVDTTELFGTPDRPVHRGRGDPESPLDIVDEFQWVPRRSVELVDEGENRQLVAPADLE